jgi:hypothetical protein
LGNNKIGSSRNSGDSGYKYRFTNISAIAPSSAKQGVTMPMPVIVIAACLFLVTAAVNLQVPLYRTLVKHLLATLSSSMHKF